MAQGQDRFGDIVDIQTAGGLEMVELVFIRPLDDRLVAVEASAVGAHPRIGPDRHAHGADLEGLGRSCVAILHWASPLSRAFSKSSTDHDSCGEPSPAVPAPAQPRPAVFPATIAFPRSFGRGTIRAFVGSSSHVVSPQQTQ